MKQQRHSFIGLNWKRYPVRTLLLLGFTTIGCVVMVNLYLSSLEAQIESKGCYIPVITAAKDLKPGDMLGLDDIQTTPIPQDACLTGIYIDERQQQLVGKRVAIFMQKGDQITDVKVANKSVAPADVGRRWYLLKDVSMASSGTLKEGDKVDIISVSNSVDGIFQVSTIAQNITVSSLVSGDSELYNLNMNDTGVIIDVTLEQAQIIALAEELGSLTLVKRAENDNRQELIRSTTEVSLTLDSLPSKEMDYHSVEVISGTQSQLFYLPMGRSN